MAGLKGLIKGDRPDQEEDAERFIVGATERLNVHNNKTTRERVYKTYTFSLTEAISQKIDNLLDLIPRKQRASRSDIVKVGVTYLSSLSEEELNKLVIEVTRKN